MTTTDDTALAKALVALERAYGTAPRVSTHWCIAWGGEDANDCAGRLEYDGEAEARDMTQWVAGGLVAKQTVISLPWQAVAGEVPSP